MALNPKQLFQLKERWNTFHKEHPKMSPFFKMLGEKAAEEGTILEIKATTPDGQEYSANMRLTANDIKTINLLTKQ